MIQQNTSSLSQLEMGQKAQVVGVSGQGEVSHRLLEMGVTPGVEVRLLRAAPLGDPLEFEIRGYRLSLRRSEADQIDVTKVTD